MGQVSIRLNSTVSVWFQDEKYYYGLSVSSFLFCLCRANVKSNDQTGTESKRECIVVPAFETFDTRTVVPSTKQTLLNAWEQRVILPFRHRIWTRGHLATNYTKWRNATQLYQVRSKSIYWF